MKPRKPYTRKLKKCISCGISKPIWSKGRCQFCAGVAAKKKTYDTVKTKKKAIKDVAKIVTICDKDIDQVFSWLVRTLYPTKCHACGKKKSYSTLECCHMVPRAKLATRWDLRNCYPGCFECNHEDQYHVVHLAKMCDDYYGEGTADELHRLAKIGSCQWPADMRVELYRMITDALKDAQKRGSDKDEIRISFIQQTKRIL